MSNPYDPNQPPPPYGAPAPGAGSGTPPYGGTPYPVGSPYDGNQPKGTDAVSITGFVLSLTCCLSIVGAILGFIGLGRTKNGQRKGRWAAVSATIIGIIGTLVFAGGIVFVVIFANSVITVDDAKVGQCANVTQNNDTYTLTEKDCSGDHDAEIVYVGKFSDLDSANVVPDDINDLSDAAISQAACSSVMSADDVSSLPDGLEWTLALEDPKDPKDSDPFICFVQNDNGDKLDSKLIG